MLSTREEFRRRGPRSLPKVRERRCKKCKGVRREAWSILDDTVHVSLISYEEDDRGKKWRHDYCDACLIAAGLRDEIDRRTNVAADLDADEGDW